MSNEYPRYFLPEKITNFSFMRQIDGLFCDFMLPDGRMVKKFTDRLEVERLIAKKRLREITAAEAAELLKGQTK